jgi:hypothetical protein
MQMVCLFWRIDSERSLFVNDEKRRTFPTVFPRAFIYFDGSGCKQVIKNFLSFPLFQAPKLSAQHGKRTSTSVTFDIAQHFFLFPVKIAVGKVSLLLARA